VPFIQNEYFPNIEKVWAQNYPRGFAPQPLIGFLFHDKKWQKEMQNNNISKPSSFPPFKDMKTSLEGHIFCKKF